MRINTLLSALHLKKENLNKQNLQGNIVVINQGDSNDVESISNGKLNLTIYSNKDRGIGKSRNLAILKSDSEICVLADDDEVFVDNYNEILIRNYKNYSDADVILFNVKRNNDPNKIRKFHKITYLNCFKYGAVNISFKKSSIVKKKIAFSEHFGGGAIFGSGEDSKFIIDCLKNDLKIIAVNETIATIKDERASTWFVGFNDRFFFDKGALFSAFNLKYGYLLGILVVIKSFRNKGELSILSKLMLFTKGYNYYKKTYMNKEQQ
ncbi:glycosyltransferase family A protein [Macrococcus capreoli]|uniref:glycosyltransferase family A protein n=1 Tax=Macrococcus capreoli TaxID=2982690 RepID=UPI003EE4C91D